MLAWLMRRGWVTQLCTYAYVVVWPEIIYEVDYEMEAEDLAAASASSLEPPKPQTIAEEQEHPLSPTSTIDSVLQQQQQQQQQPQPQQHSSSSPSPHPDPSSIEHVAERARLERIATKAHHRATERAMNHARKIPPQATPHPSLNDAPHLKGLTPHIILDAKKATGKEARYLSAIGKRFTDDKGKRAWQLFCRYFDGRCALERVALQEDMKRKEVWNLLTHMTEYVLCTRHW
jgi:hypothetical protein